MTKPITTLTNRNKKSFVNYLLQGSALTLSLLLSSSSHAALSLSIDTYTTDELTFSISGSLDADVIGDVDIWLAVKNDWSNNIGTHTAMP